MSCNCKSSVASKTMECTTIVLCIILDCNGFAG